MRIVFLSHTAMGGAFVVGSHHLAKAFSRQGHEVTHVSAPVSLPHFALALRDEFVRTRIRRWFHGGEEIDGVEDVVPLTPLPWNIARRSRALMRGYSRVMLPAPLRSLASLRLDSADFLIIDEPRFAGLATQGCAAGIIYRATDLYSLMRGDPSIVDAERWLCEASSALVATSQPVARHLEQISGRPVSVMANGVDFDHFAGRSLLAAVGCPELPGRPEDRAVYVGAFDNRFGRDAFSCAVGGLPDKCFVLVGPGSEQVAADFPRSRVLGLGAVKYASLPGILRQCAVGLLPLSTQASNSGRSPMKLYEYLAAGLCVAATSTAELARRGTPAVILAESPPGFSSAVRRAFELAGDDDLRARALQSARAESWESKALQLVEMMRACAPRGESGAARSLGRRGGRIVAREHPS